MWVEIYAVISSIPDISYIIFGIFLSFFLNNTKNCWEIQKIIPLKVPNEQTFLSNHLMIIGTMLLVEMMYTDTQNKNRKISMRRSRKELRTFFDLDTIYKLLPNGFVLQIFIFLPEPYCKCPYDKHLCFDQNPSWTDSTGFIIYLSYNCTHRS